MSLYVRNTLNELLVAIYKNITLFLFFILPSKVSNIFVSLSILALIHDVRHVGFKHNKISEDKFNNLLHISFNEEIMLLPSYTLHWFWKEDFLNHQITIDQRQLTLKEAIENDEILYKHLRYITDLLIENIPSILRFKLDLGCVKSKLTFKHNIMNLLMYC